LSPVQQAANLQPHGTRNTSETGFFRDSPRANLHHVSKSEQQEGIMLYWTIVFFVIALIAGVLGFTGVAVAAAGIAKLLFFVFLVLFVISLITHLGRRGSGV
jgi:uncharacterized membrane protein YtjA (UPF0391 family)